MATGLESKTLLAFCHSPPLDVGHDAITLYEDNNGAFKYMQCWYVLHDSTKWGRGTWRSGNDKRKTPKKCQRKGDSDEPDTTVPAALTLPSTNTSRPAPLEMMRVRMESARPRWSANLALYARQVKAAERTRK